MTRRTAALVWASMLVVPVAFLGVAAGVARQASAPHLAGPLLALAIAASALNVVLARFLPPRLGPARAHDRDAVAFCRILVCLALCEAAALAPLVAYMVSGDVRLLVVFAADVGVLLGMFPTDRRWDALLPEPDGAQPPPRAGVR